MSNPDSVGLENNKKYHFSKHTEQNFSHNDVHEGNILIDERVKKQGKDESECLRLIDFEYSAYGYRGFDFANHFNEWMYDYSNPEWPHYYYNPHHFPSEGNLGPHKSKIITKESPLNGAHIS